MARLQDRSKKKITGGNYRRPPKRLSRIGRSITLTRIEEKKIKLLRKKGGEIKSVLLAINKINVFDPKSKKFKIADIKTVVENPANRHFVRRNILTKGTVVDTSIGKVRITSRPGQEGTLNGILI